MPVLHCKSASSHLSAGESSSLGITPERVVGETHLVLAHGATVNVSSPELRDHGLGAVNQAKGNTGGSSGIVPPALVSV